MASSMKRTLCRRPTLPEVNLEGRVAIVTGGTSGIGLVTVRRLAELGADVIVACRNVEKGEGVVATLQQQAAKPMKLRVMELELSSLQSVQRFAAAFQELGLGLHLLINNAGLVHTSYITSKDGLEEMFAVNHLAHFLLTLLLLPTLKASAPSRIVHVASTAHGLCKSLDTESLDKPCAISGISSSFKVYGRSKLCNILFSNELAKRLHGTGVTSNSLHPGAVNTNLGLEHASRLVQILATPVRWFMKDVEQGAMTTMHCAISPELAGVSGKYFSDCAEAKPEPQALDSATAVRLWEVSCALVKDRAGIDLSGKELST